MDCGFIDIYHLLKPVYEKHSPDGVHMDARGQMIIAESIRNYLAEQ